MTWLKADSEDGPWPSGAVRGIPPGLTCPSPPGLRYCPSFCEKWVIRRWLRLSLCLPRLVGSFLRREVHPGKVHAMGSA